MAIFWSRGGVVIAVAAAILAPLTAGIGPAAAAEPAAWKPDRGTTCDLGAWAGNEPKAGIDVRAAPSLQSAVLGQLPTADPPGGPEYDYSVLFRIIEANGDWLKITGASDDYNADETRQARPVYAGEGWIPADAARIGIQSGRGYQRPDAASARLVDLGSDWLTEMGRIRRIAACSGEWVLLDFTIDRRREAGGGLTEMRADQQTTGQAWFRGVCSSQETTCDMRSVDEGK